VRAAGGLIGIDAEALRDLAESPPSPAPPAGGASRRISEQRYLIEIGPDPDPDMNIVSRLRLDGHDVSAAVEHARATFRAAGRREATWEVGSGATPPGLADRLRAEGMTDHEPGSMLALACTTEPASPTSGIETERVETASQFEEVRAIFAEADGWHPSEEWLRGPGYVTRYLARTPDGRAVATADITWLEHDRAVFLGGALTLPEFRGRGAYRSLVHRRWQEAARRGRTVLVTQSEPMSQPILLRLGFEAVGEITVLVDRFG
jgi:GNAT superfamily N-acetyltransferase